MYHSLRGIPTYDLSEKKRKKRKRKMRKRKHKTFISALKPIYNVELFSTAHRNFAMVICLQRGADLHMTQLMPLPLTASCFSKIQIGFTFLVVAHTGSPGKRAVKRVCVYVFLPNEVLIFRQEGSYCYTAIVSTILVAVAQWFVHPTAV